MCVKLPLENLNLSPCLPHSTSTYPIKYKIYNQVLIFYASLSHFSLNFLHNIFSISTQI